MVMEDCGSSRKGLHNSKGVDSKEAEERRKLEECKLIREKCFSPSREKKKENVALNSELGEALPSVKAINLKYKNHLTKVDIQLIKAEISRFIDPYLTPDDRKRLDMVLQYAFKSCTILIGRQGPRPFPSSQEIGASNLFDPLQPSDTNLTDKIIENSVAEMVKKIDKLTTPFLPEDTRKRLNKIIVSILSNDSLKRDYDPTPVNKGTLDTNLGTLHQDDIKIQKDTSTTENSLNMLPIPQDSAVSDTGQSVTLSETQDNKVKHRYYLTDNSIEADTPVDPLFKTTSPENNNIITKPELSLPIVDEKTTEDGPPLVVKLDVSVSEQDEDAADIKSDDTAAEPQLSSPVPYVKKEPLENENTLSLLNIAPCENQYSFPGPDSNMKPPSDEAFSPEVISNRIELNNDSSNEGHDEKTYDSIIYTKEELEMKDRFKMNSHHPSHLFTIKSYLTSEENTSLLGEPLKGYSSNMLSRDPIFNSACKAGLATEDYAPSILTDEQIREILSEINRQTSKYLPPDTIAKLKTEIHHVLTLAASENAWVHSVPDENCLHTLPDNLKHLVESVECCRCAMTNNESVGRYTNRQSMFYDTNRSYSSGNADGNEFLHLNKRGEKFFDPETGILSTRPPNYTYRNSETFRDAHDDMAMVRKHYDCREELDMTEDEKILIRRQDFLNAIETFLDEISPRGFNSSSIQETMEALRRQGKIEFVRQFFKNELSGIPVPYPPIPPAPYSPCPPSTTDPKSLCPMPATAICASLESSPCRPQLPPPPGPQTRISSCSPPTPRRL